MAKQASRFGSISKNSHAMSLARITGKTAPFILLFLTFSFADAQEKSPIPAHPSNSVEREIQDPIKIYTQEVILPIVAYDEYRHFDPTVELGDLLVLEDDVPQRVTSIRRAPTNVVLLIDMGTRLVLTQHLDTTRQLVTGLLSHLGSEDQVTLIQFTNHAEVLQDWTVDKARVVRALNPAHGKVLSGNVSRLTEGIAVAAEKLKGKPAGTTHIVLITGGDFALTSEVENADSVRRLLTAQPVLHVISYARLVRQEVKRERSTFSLDREMKNFYKDYEKAVGLSEQRLTALSETLGGQMLLPKSLEEALKGGNEIASDIGAQYVVAYARHRPFESSGPAPRRVKVVSRRVGLQVHSLRNSVIL